MCMCAGHDVVELREGAKAAMENAHPGWWKDLGADFKEDVVSALSTKRGQR